MCPFCKEHDGKACAVTEKPNGHLVCGCGAHSWPNSGAFLETCRKLSLTVTGQVHVWTQSY
jgi:hypothetical protein